MLCPRTFADSAPGNTTREDRQNDLAKIEMVLDSKSLWSFCYHDDPFVRRAMYTLIRTVVSGEPEELDWRLVSAALMGKSLHIMQLGSASDLSEALLHVTSARPQIWTDDYSGKTSSSKRLLQYIRKGSQGSTGLFWSNIYQLLQLVPIQMLSKLDPDSPGQDIVGISSAKALMEAIHEGLSSREEPPQNRTLGWKIYVETAMWLAQGLDHHDTVKLLHDQLSPLIIQYVKPEQEAAQWSLPRHSSESICTEYLTALFSFGYETAFNELWTKLSDDLIEAIRLSSPEQSKDFKSSQDAVCSQAGRLFSLEASLLSRLADQDLEPKALHTLESLNLGLLNNCLEILRTRNGKPYGATAVVEEVVRRVPQIAQHSQELLNFIQKDAPELLFSPSGDQLITIILLCRAWPGFASSFEELVRRVAQLENVMTNASAVQKLLSSLDLHEVDNEILGPLIMRALELACKGSQLHWSVVISALQNPTCQGELEDSVFLSLLENLSVDDEILDTLQGLKQIVTSASNAAKRFQTSSQGPKLTGKLLLFTESYSEDIAGLAQALIDQMKKSAVVETSPTASLEIVRENLAHANEESLS